MVMSRYCLDGQDTLKEAYLKDSKCLKEVFLKEVTMSLDNLCIYKENYFCHNNHSIDQSINKLIS